MYIDKEVELLRDLSDSSLEEGIYVLGEAVYDRDGNFMAKIESGRRPMPDEVKPAKEQLGVCDNTKTPHVKMGKSYCINWRPVEASASESLGLCDANPIFPHPKGEDSCCKNWRDSLAGRHPTSEIAEVQPSGYASPTVAGGTSTVQADRCSPESSAPSPTLSESAVEEAVRVVDGMTCRGCLSGWQTMPQENSEVWHYPHPMNVGEIPEKCTAQGRAINDVYVRLGWRKS